MQALTHDLVARIVSHWKDEGKVPLADVLELVESEVITQIVAACDGNRAEGARQMHLNRSTLVMKLKSFEAKFPKAPVVQVEATQSEASALG